MYGYKCDKCGALMMIDSNEERICDACLAERQDRERPAEIEYRHQKREVRHAG